MVWRVLAVLVINLALVCGLSSPVSADDPDAWDVYFTGTWHNVTTDPITGSSDVVDNAHSTQVLSCRPDGCTYSESDERELVISASSPTASLTWPESGDDICTEDWIQGGSVTVSFTGTTLRVHGRYEPSGQDDCGYGVETVYEFVGEWVGKDAAELCGLTGGPCALDAGAGAAPNSAASSHLDSAAAAPSVLSALATPAQAGVAPQQLVLAALVTIVLLLLVAFPTALLNSASESGAERLAAWRARRSARREPAPTTRAWSRSWGWAALGVLAASVISSFVDPGLGFNAGSIRVVLSLLVGFALDVVLGWSVVIWLTRRLVPSATHSYAFQPLSLLIVVVAVVFSRVTGFQPGILFGLVAGVAFGGVVGAAAKARSTLASLGWAFALAVVAWLGYGALAGFTGESFWATFAVETLSGIATGGMAALPIALVPLKGLTGHTLWSWNRWVWAGCYAVGLFAFFVVLMPMPFSWGDVSWSLWAWICAYLAYAAVAVGAWLLLSRPWQRDRATAPDASGTVTTDGTEPDAEPANAAQSAPAEQL